MQINCPHCGKQYNVSDDQIGHKVQCKNCEKSFSISPKEPTPSKKTNYKAQGKIAVTSIVSALTIIGLLILIIIINNRIVSLDYELQNQINKTESQYSYLESANRELVENVNNAFIENKEQFNKTLQDYFDYFINEIQIINDNTAWLDPAKNHYSIMKSRGLPLLVSIAKVEQHLDSCKVILKLGNINNLTLNDPVLKVKYGKRFEGDYEIEKSDNWKKSLQSSEFKTDISLVPGYWTLYEVVLSGIKKEDLGYVEVDYTFSTIQMPTMTSPLQGKLNN